MISASYGERPTRRVASATREVGKRRTCGPAFSPHEVAEDRIVEDGVIYQLAGGYYPQRSVSHDYRDGAANALKRRSVGNNGGGTFMYRPQLSMAIQCGVPLFGCQGLLSSCWLSCLGAQKVACLEFAWSLEGEYKGTRRTSFERMTHATV